VVYLRTNSPGVLIMVGAIRETRKIPVYRDFQAGHYLFTGRGRRPVVNVTALPEPDILICGIQELQMGFLPVAQSDRR
jgi:hypothetical protein